MNIKEKMRSYLEKKNKSLEVIQEKLNDDFMKQHTFAPNVNNPKHSMIRRNLDQFLEDQKNHCKKLKDKLEVLRENKLQESVNNLSNAPKINQTSKKLAENKLKNEQHNSGSKVYERLYNKRNPNQNNSNNKPNAAKSPSKILNKKVIERTQNLYQDALNRQNKQKENLKKIHTIEKPMLKKSNFNSNKYILKKFTMQYSDEVERVFANFNINSSSNDLNNKYNKLNFNQLVNLMQNLNFINHEINENENELDVNTNNPLTSKIQERKLIIDLYESIKDHEGLVNLDHLFIFCLSILNLLEYFVVKSYKGQGNKTKSGNTITNNTNDNNSNSNGNNCNTNNEDELSHFQSIKKESSQKNLKHSNSNQKIIKKDNSIKNLKDEEIESLILKLNSDLCSRIAINKKYGGFDEDNNFIITFTNAKLILKDYNLCSFNYSNSGHKNKQINKSQPQQEVENNFKPKINAKSIQLSNKVRQKLIHEYDSVEVNDTVVNEINRERDRDYFSPTNRNLISQHQKNLMSPPKNNSPLDFVEVMNLKKKKVEKYTEEIRKEKELKEMENCTFKPKINNYNLRDNVVPLDGVGNQRIELLYKKGTENLINKKKTKTKVDIDFEKNRRECSFKPNIYERDFQEVFDENKNQIYQDKDFIKFNERMKRGREDKEYKERMFRRGEELKSPPKNDEKRNKSETKVNTNFNNNQSNNNQENLKISFSKNENECPENNNIKICNDFLIPQDLTSKTTINKNDLLGNNDSINNISNTVNNTISNNPTNPPNNKLEKVLPLLVIDVNIRPGEKHKITVYEGDTSERLSEKFAIEHKLDYNTKNKLKYLIESQLVKLLPKIIEEENQSMKSEMSNGFV